MANPGSDAASARRAEAVREAMIARGVSPNAVVSRGFGNSRPIGTGSAENERVEIVISGDPIGTLPFWDRTYSLKSGQ